MEPNQWNQKGKIYLWSYEGNPKNYSGWHLHCDKDGAASLAELISSFSNVSEACHRTVVLSRPNEQQLRVPNCSAKAMSDKKLVVSKQGKWGIESKDGKTYFCFDAEHLSKLVDAILGIPDGKGDFNIGTKGNWLWFWW
ncbi:MAG: hypothetical protein OIF51_14140 [Cellvibrionaceae bacterium]|nr:hypothetical protein [Cellvibrionaceae bacterium]